MQLIGILGLLSSQLAAEEKAEDINLGGAGTVALANNQAFSIPFPTLAGIERLQFQAGDALYTEAWVEAPSSTQGRDGLGPLFITRACANCHLKDGRGAPPAEGEEALGFLVRVTASEPNPYGDQIQNRAILGHASEASVSVAWRELKRVLPDGKSVNLRTPELRLSNLGYGPMPADAQFSMRLAPPMHGLGLLEAVPEAVLLESADEFDANGDGISGRANYVHSIKLDRTVIGRFGWKANQPDLEQQDAAAFNGDMGLTTTLFPTPNCTALQAACLEAPDGGAPEVTDRNLRLMVLYSRLLSVPARRSSEDETVKAGRQRFMDFGCASCHRPSLKTGTEDEVAHKLLANQTIWPYTDLLLHDMGEELADNRPDERATGREWRTPPLWGIGLTEVVNGHGFYLHDGRARTLEEAILWHGGEALETRQRFEELSAADRESVLAFLRSL